ncbi:MlaD family protein [Bdellovibrio bacteriovorus]|uniref:MlaD family protein n=1 Tax=Bdellovibrio bacteriovorus TaxID=959 RepID=UPI003D070B8D
MEKDLKQRAKKIGSHWYVWLFPAFAVAISAWLLVQYLTSLGPEIIISFDEGSSIEAEKTRLSYRGVTVGKVTEVALSEDQKKVLVHARLDKSAKSFAQEGAKFWIVTPKVSIQGITGLETLIGGPYIAAQPGEGSETKEFEGKQESATQDPLEDTVTYRLETNNAESINPGDNVSFRGMNVGTVTKVSLSKTAQSLYVQINLQSKYARLVRTNTQFWRKVGVQAKLGLFKSELKINSLETLLHGGIEFFTPDPPGDIAKYNARFPLQGSAPKDWQKWNPSLER